MFAWMAGAGDVEVAGHNRECRNLSHPNQLPKTAAELLSGYFDSGYGAVFFFVDL
jgi:hypothetical protein